MRGQAHYKIRNKKPRLGASLIAIALWLLNTCTAQSDPASTKLQSDTINTASLSSRERELQRKEEELLHSMGLRASLSASDPGSAERSAKPALASKDSSVENELTHQKADTRLQFLKTVGEHPALEDRKPASTSPIQSPRIKTHKQEGSVDESTAKRLDTFRRVDDSRATNDAPRYPSKRTRPINFNETERDYATRSASLNLPDVATIKNSTARLRAAPSTRNTIISQVPQFTEVAIDCRSGDWYRVKTTSGQRGWVIGGALLFNAGISKASTVRIGAVSRARGTHPSP